MGVGEGSTAGAGLLGRCLPFLAARSFPTCEQSMANKGPSFGLSRDVQAKIEKKYDDELEERLVEWVVAQCGTEVGRPDRGRLGFQVWLKNGIVSVGCCLPASSLPPRSPLPPFSGLG